MPDLLGEYRYQMDPKGRISLPQEFREAFEGGVFLTLGQDGCLFAFSPAEWERRREEVERVPLSDQKGRWYARVFLGNARRADLDGQGRLVIPQKLRQVASLAREITVVGVGQRLEIWSAEAWERSSAPYESQYVAGTLEPSERPTPIR